MYSNRYTLLYAIAVTIVVAVTLALAAGGLRSRQEENIARAKRIAILGSVMEVNPDTLDDDYNTIVSEYVFDSEGREVAGVGAFDVEVIEEASKLPSERRYPLYVAQRDGLTHYIVPVEGSGLWGPLRAFVALEADLNTIYGVVFSHDKETPGLGAEISTPDFQDRFRGKRLFGDDGTYESVQALRGSGNDVEARPHEVDGLTGATMTINGVNEMMEGELALYTAIFDQLR